MIENERKTFPTCLPGKHSRKRGMLFVGGCSQGWGISVPSPLSHHPPPKKKKDCELQLGICKLAHERCVLMCV